MSFKKKCFLGHPSPQSSVILTSAVPGISTQKQTDDRPIRLKSHVTIVGVFTSVYIFDIRVLSCFRVTFSKSFKDIDTVSKVHYFLHSSLVLKQLFNSTNTSIGGIE